MRHCGLGLLEIAYYYFEGVVKGNDSDEKAVYRGASGLIENVKRCKTLWFLAFLTGLLIWFLMCLIRFSVFLIRCFEFLRGLLAELLEFSM